LNPVLAENQRQKQIEGSKGVQMHVESDEENHDACVADVGDGPCAEERPDDEDANLQEQVRDVVRKEDAKLCEEGAKLSHEVIKGLEEPVGLVWLCLCLFRSWRILIYIAPNGN
jgi:hypothetical protein